jgi:hypothetical protein
LAPNMSGHFITIQTRQTNIVIWQVLTLDLD